MEKLDLALLTKDELLTLVNNAANRFMDGKNPEVQKKIFNIVGDEINRRRKDEEAEARLRDDPTAELTPAQFADYEDDPRQKGIEGHIWEEGARLNGDYR